MTTDGNCYHGYRYHSQRAGYNLGGVRIPGDNTAELSLYTYRYLIGLYNCWTLRWLILASHYFFSGISSALRIQGGANIYNAF